MKNPWKKLGSKVVYKNPYWQAREYDVIKPDGSRGVYEVVEKKPFVMIIPLTERGEVYLTRQWRVVVDKNSWELPAGSTFKNENPKQAAARELKEETGLTAGALKKIGQARTSNGFTNELFYVFVATGLKQGKSKLEPSESDMICKKFSIKKIDQMIISGEIQDAPTIAALNILKIYLQNKTSTRL